MTGLYIHIPFCESKCSYCSFYSEPLTKHSTKSLVSALINELSAHNPEYLANKIETVYIGGGTPTSIPHQELFNLCDEVAGLCPNIKEFTVESNPAQLTSSLLDGLLARKVNRLSIGAQSFNESELKTLGRIHSANQIETAFNLARQAGFKNISLDLIFALPASTIEDFKFSLDKAIALSPEHISAYSLSIEPNTEFAKALTNNQITPTDEETDRAMYEMAIETIESAGIMQYEISNFAKPGCECKHNLGTWANNEYIGIGPAASSYFKGFRYTNIASVKTYIENMDAGKSVVSESTCPDNAEIACQTAVLNLRARKGINIKDFKAKTGYDLLTTFAEPLARNLEQGNLEVIEKYPDNIRLTQKALPIADKILCDFAAI